MTDHPDPITRSLQARAAAHTRWAKEDPAANAARAQAGLLARFEREVDPHGRLDAAERHRRAVSARRAHMLRLALRSKQVREARRGGA